jgi:hypothetical protein
MTTRSFQTLIVTIAIVVLAACSAAGTTSPAGTSPTTTGSETPITSDAPPVGDPGVGENPGAGGELTIPRPGQLDVHPVPAESLEAAVDGRKVTVRIGWTSGVEPCNVLDSIVVEPAGMAFALTIHEGHAPGDNICIEIAKFKFALVDLGELAPGTYTISDAMGGAAPIEVVIS